MREKDEVQLLSELQDCDDDMVCWPSLFIAAYTCCVEYV